MKENHNCIPFKKLIAVILIALLLCSVTGCGKAKVTYRQDEMVKIRTAVPFC